MRKITLLLLATTFTVVSTAQNVLQNHSFENDPATFTVIQHGKNALMRIAGIQSTVTETNNPTSAATPVTDGLWTKKSPSSGYIRATLNTETTQDGTTSLNLYHLANNGMQGLDTKWFNCIAEQKIAGGLDQTKKYTVTFYAKVDDTAGNVCDKVNVFTTDNTNKTNYLRTVELTGGTTWTKYTTEFDLPSHVIKNSTSDFTTAYFGFSITTTYNAKTKTNYSGVLLDNIVLVKTEDLIGTGIQDNKASSFTAIGATNAVKLKNIKRGQKVSVYNLTGSLVASKTSVFTELSIKLNKGIYLVRVDNTTKKVLVK